MAGPDASLFRGLKTRLLQRICRKSQRDFPVFLFFLSGVQPGRRVPQKEFSEREPMERNRTSISSDRDLESLLPKEEADSCSGVLSQSGAQTIRELTGNRLSAVKTT